VGAEGPVRGGMGGGVSGGSPGLSMVVRLDGEKPMMGAGTGGHRGCRIGR
jgi:hypothetical protein